MYEFEAIVILAATFIIVYIIGAFRNRKLLVKYSRLIKSQVQSMSEYTGFRPLGSNGFRALINMNKEQPLSKIEIAVSLVDRENVMHYPLSLLTKEHDKVTMWVFPKVRPKFSLEITPNTGNPPQKRPAGLNLTDMPIDRQDLKEAFLVASSNKRKAEETINDGEITSKLLRTRDFLSYFLIDEGSSRIFLTGKLTEESLGPLIDLAVTYSGKI